ncbi:MAG: hypothetical protein IJT71_03695 [Oscillospiraceae bacterium]|nr:hypothetical protein [Oscillospiraceae bacterium]
MRRKDTRGYAGYRGRKTVKRGWWIAALVVIILAAAAFLFAQRYRVYRSDGSSRYELPWFHRAEARSETAADEGLEIVIERRMATGG